MPCKDDGLLAQCAAHGLMRWWAHGRGIEAYRKCRQKNRQRRCPPFIYSAFTARYFINDSTDFHPPRTQEDSGTVQLCFFFNVSFSWFCCYN